MPTWTSLTPDSVEQWAELVKVLAHHDDTGEFFEAEDLAEELTEHGVDPALDSWAVWDGENLIGYGQLWVSDGLDPDGLAVAELNGGVHPRWRGRGVGTELLARMQTRALTLARQRHPGAVVQLRTEGRDEGSDARPLLGDLGYRPMRYFTDMTCQLGDRPPRASSPATHSRGVTVRPFIPDLTEASRTAHNDAFATHWGSVPASPQRWADVVGSRGFRPADSRLAVDGEQVLAYALTGEWSPRELHVMVLGTRQSARGRGLARLVLDEVVAAAADSGRYDLIELEVDSQNPTGAGALYTSVGFVPVRTSATMVRTIAGE
ncbi:MAG: GNAT family N-acetyltransferase [Actinomycetales bacterium]